MKLSKAETEVAEKLADGYTLNCDRIADRWSLQKIDGLFIRVSCATGRNCVRKMGLAKLPLDGRQRDRYTLSDLVMCGEGEMKKVRVFFEQVNYCMIEVDANSRASAERKAVKEWKARYKEPTITSVEWDKKP